MQLHFPIIAIFSHIEFALKSINNSPYKFTPSHIGNGILYQFIKIDDLLPDCWIIVVEVSDKDWRIGGVKIHEISLQFFLREIHTSTVQIPKGIPTKLEAIPTLKPDGSIPVVHDRKHIVKLM